MSTSPSKKAKVEDLPPCPYGSKCYRKNPTHFTEFSHSNHASTSSDNPTVIKPSKDNKLPVCPFGATCYRKSLLHFAQYSHPFDLLNPDHESSDEDESKESEKKVEIVNQNKKRTFDDDDDDGEKTEEYDTDDEDVYDVKLEKTFSKMTDAEKRLMIEQAFELKDKLQEKLKKTREETKQREKEIEELENKIDEGIVLMEGEDEVLKGTKVKYFELFPERNYKQGSAAELHFRLAESQFYRLLNGKNLIKITKVEYVCNPILIKNFNQARAELKKSRGEEYSYPILAFHATDADNIKPICENGFKIPDQTEFKQQHKNGSYGRGIYFSEYPGCVMEYIKDSTTLLLCQILQGKVYKCDQKKMDSNLQDGYDSHCSPDKKELVIFQNDYILPLYIVHHRSNMMEFRYIDRKGQEAVKEKLAKIGKLYKKAIAVKSKNIFGGYKFALIGQMADTPIAMEALIKRFGGYVCKNPVPLNKAGVTTGLFAGGYLASALTDTPNIIICSLAEAQATTPSAELQTYKDFNLTYYLYREDFLYDSIIQGGIMPYTDYAHY